MSDQRSATAEVYPEQSQKENYGLHAGVLGPLETLAQSVSAMAPSTSPSLTIPLVFAIAGNATWFVYLLATGATLLVGFCVSRFARLSASPGSLYTYTAETLPPVFGVAAAWGLLLAYFGDSGVGGRWRALLHQRAFAAIPPLDTADSADAPRGLRGCRLCRLSRRKALRGIDAMDRNLFHQPHLHRPHRHAGPIRFSSRHGPVPPARCLVFRPWSSARALHVQLRRIRKRNHAWQRGAQPAADHPARRDSMRHPRRSFLRSLLVLRGAGISRRIRQTERDHQPVASSCRQGWCVVTGNRTSTSVHSSAWSPACSPVSLRHHASCCAWRAKDCFLQSSKRPARAIARLSPQLCFPPAWSSFRLR